MFEVASTIIDSSELRRRMSNGEAGALVVFEGWVRNHNEGQAVEALEYEVYEALAVAEADRIIAEAHERWDCKQIHAVHRQGLLSVGDVAVWVGVSSAHRAEAFEACRYVIDEIKQRLPIWKLEHYVSGERVWVNCQQCAGHQHEPAAKILEVRNDRARW